LIEPVSAPLSLLRPESVRSARGNVALAIAIVIGEPRLWILGIAGFLFRGGWLVLAVPIWTMPSPVAVTTLIGADAIGTGGVTPGLVTVIAAIFVVVVLILVVSAVGSAWVDLLGFEHFVRERETADLRAGRQPVALSAGNRRGVVLRLVSLYAGALVPAAAALIVAAIGIGQATYQDFLLPGRLEVPLLLRVAGAATAPLLVLALLLVAAEVIASVGTRRLLGSRFGLREDGGRSRPTDQDKGTGARASGSKLLALVRTVALCWATTLLFVIPGLASTLTGWAAIRTVFLAPDALRDLDATVAAGGITLLFVALWGAALVLAGVSSALRSALWSGWWLGEADFRTVTNSPSVASR
jgi:hypothetical protein